jgi:putative transposase
MRIENRESGNSYFSKRRRRIDDARTARSLTFSCYKRFQFLSKDRTRLWFVDAIQESRAKFPVDLWAWVIMPEHVHFLVYPREKGRVIGRFQGFLKERVARKAITWLKENSPEWLSRITVVEGTTTRRRFWQPGGGYDRNIEQDKVILATIEYLHQNPVRRGLVERSTDWEWSSARWYNGDADCRLEMDRTLPMIYEGL